MKKSCHIMLSVLLSVTILSIGSGLDIMRCAHTGKVRVLSAFTGDFTKGMDSKACSMTSSCMSVTHVELSPTMTAQTISYDFHGLQPVMAVLPCLVAEWSQPETDKVSVQPVRDVWKSPPRDYLNKIQVLLI
jgi:hypothetical protein